MGFFRSVVSMSRKLLLFLIAFLPLSSLLLFAQVTGPDRRVVMALEYPGVDVLPGESSA